MRDLFLTDTADFLGGVGSTCDSPSSGGAIRSDGVTLQEIATLFGGSCHGASGRDVISRSAPGTSQAEVLFVELDAYAGIDLYGTAEVIHKGYGVLVGHEHEAAVSGGEGYGVGKSCGYFLAEDKPTVHEAAVYTVLVPYDLTLEFDEDRRGRYAVAVASVATCRGEEDEE